MEKMSKKALKAEAERLDAVRLMKGENRPAKTIYDYERERDMLCEKLNYRYYGVAYSVGTYDNTGRIDKIVDKNGEIVDFVFYTED